MIEAIFVTTLFLLYLIMWKVKRLNQIKVTGEDPEVLSKSKSGVQRYMNFLLKALTAYAALIIVLHSFNIQYRSAFSRFAPFNPTYFDFIGFFIGLAGLSICLYAQIKMGNSWRVGIDETNETDLVTTGLYRFIRNPTYFGLFILNFGVWLIWPTWTIFIFNLIFVLTLEFQVRCEEDFLYSKHGNKYSEYVKRTKRYIPYIYCR